MQAFKSRHFVVPVAAVLTFTAHLAAAQAQAPAASDKARAEMQAKPAGSSDRTTTSPASRAATRDWAQVDTNKDNHVSPEEMEAYLKANPGPLARK